MKRHEFSDGVDPADEAALNALIEEAVDVDEGWSSLIARRSDPGEAAMSWRRRLQRWRDEEAHLSRLDFVLLQTGEIIRQVEAIPPERFVDTRELQQASTILRELTTGLRDRALSRSEALALVSQFCRLLRHVDVKCEVVAVRLPSEDPGVEEARSLSSRLQDLRHWLLSLGVEIDRLFDDADEFLPLSSS